VGGGGDQARKERGFWNTTGEGRDPLPVKRGSRKNHQKGSTKKKKKGTKHKRVGQVDCTGEAPFLTCSIPARIAEQV